MNKTTAGQGSTYHNPFIIGHHAEGDGFCNRRAEVARIATAWRDPASRLLVYGERRLGKSSTLHEAARLVRAEHRHVVIVDLAAAPTASAAAQRILSAVQRELGTRWRDLANGLLKRLRPGAFSLQASTDAVGQPTISFQVAPSFAAQDEFVVAEVLDAIENELDQRNETLALGLDEFQRLGRWYGDDIAWQFKELLERHRRIAYVLAGSEKTLIELMLKNRKAGLWKVVDVLEMQPVPAAELTSWIHRRAADTGVNIDLIVAAAIVRLAGPRTRDIVQLARATWDWSRATGIAMRNDAEHAMDLLVLEQGAMHQRQWEQLSDVSRGLLIALVTAPATQLLAARSLIEYNLGPKSTASSALAELVAREVLTRRDGARRGFVFDDPFFRRWVEVNVTRA